MNLISARAESKPTKPFVSLYTPGLQSVDMLASTGCTSPGLSRTYQADNVRRNRGVGARRGCTCKVTPTEDPMNGLSSACELQGAPSWLPRAVIARSSVECCCL